MPPTTESSDSITHGGSRRLVLALVLVAVGSIFSRGRTHLVMQQSAEISQLRREVSILLEEVQTLREASIRATNSSAPDSPPPLYPPPPTQPPPPKLSEPQQTTRIISSPVSPRHKSSAAVVPTKVTGRRTAKIIMPPPNINTTNATRFCYCSMMANIDDRYKFRVYLSGIIVFTARLRAVGSTFDMVVLVNFKPNGGLSQLPESDLEVLQKWGIKLKYVDSIWDRFLDNEDAAKIPDVKRAKEKSVMYNKIFAWEMVEYDWVQYVDADVMPTANMDRYFQTQPRTTFTRGWMSPLQGAWYLLKPDLKTFQDLVGLVQHRYSDRWDPRHTWDVLHERPHTSETKNQNQACLDDDQGLFWCYFRFSKRAPAMDWVDHKNALVKGVHTVERGQVTKVQNGKGTFKFLYEHFGGRAKPWRVCADPKANLRNIAANHAHHWPQSKYASFVLYCKTFDELGLRDLVTSVYSPLKR